MLSLKEIKIIVGAIVICALLGMFQYIRIQSAEIDKIELERDTAQKSLKLCNEDKLLTERVENGYQTEISKLRRSVNDYKRVLDNPTCHAVTGQTGRPDAAAAPGQHVRPDGLRSEWLVDFAAECEGFRLQVIGLQDFINQTWARE